MSHTRLRTLAAIVALIIVIGFALSAPHTRDVARPKESSASADVPTVTLHDAFKKGVHTIAGSVAVPDACTMVTVQATLVSSASSTSGILVALSLPQDTDVCLQLPTVVNFSATIPAPANLPIEVTVNGAAATTSAP